LSPPFVGRSCRRSASHASQVGGAFKSWALGSCLVDRASRVTPLWVVPLGPAFWVVPLLGHARYGVAPFSVAPSFWSRLSSRGRAKLLGHAVFVMVVPLLGHATVAAPRRPCRSGHAESGRASVGSRPSGQASQVMLLGPRQFRVTSHVKPRFSEPAPQAHLLQQSFMHSVRPRLSLDRTRFNVIRQWYEALSRCALISGRTPARAIHGDSRLALRCLGLGHLFQTRPK